MPGEEASNSSVPLSTPDSRAITRHSSFRVHRLLRKANSESSAFKGTILGHILPQHAFRHSFECSSVIKEYIHFVSSFPPLGGGTKHEDYAG